MKIDVHHHTTSDDRLWNKLLQLEQRLMTIQDTINALIAKVQAENTVIGGVATLIKGLRDQITALTSAGQPVDPATLQSLSDAIDAGSTQLAAAVASTPAATTPVTPASS
jgi:hypothetical protein